MRLLKILWHYWKTKRLHFETRQALEIYQEKKLTQFKQHILTKSAYFKHFCDRPLNEWPLMNKKIMMLHFDKMNTENLQRDELLNKALQSENSKDFSPKVGIFSVGLSSGTSGERGLFVVSPTEQEIWAGGILAKTLPRGLFAKERVALFLRADNHLYHSANTPWLSLKFWGLFENFKQQVDDLNHYKPTIIVAPAQVLTVLAKEKLNGRLTFEPYKVISAAEVLDAQDKTLLQTAFREVGEVYQATEGFLAATCPLGTLHLNEEFIHVEPYWLDENRFTPIITDFTRTTQPIVRYQLDDILVKRQTPCLCGQQGMALSHIEGRQDDQIILQDQKGNALVIFADYCNRIMATTLPLRSDYRLIQKSAHEIELIGACAEAYLIKCQQALSTHFMNQGAMTSNLTWILTSVTNIPIDFTRKKRRIIRQGAFS